MVTMLTSCPWCNELNFGERANCKCCGHETHKPRLDCQCQQCLLRKQVDVDQNQAKQNSARAPFGI
jgi:hypothetical protein